MYTHNEMLMNFINVMFPNGFSDENEEYAVVFFRDNEGRGAKKINFSEDMVNEIIDQASTLNANEVILIHSQPTGDLNSYPVLDDINLFSTIETGLDENSIEMYNNVVLSKSTGQWQCTSFKDIGQPGNFK